MKYENIKLELIKNSLLLKNLICDLRKYAGYEIIKMTADIFECSEVDADLVMLCRTSKCGESPDSRRCYEYC